MKAFLTQTEWLLCSNAMVLLRYLVDSDRNHLAASYRRQSEVFDALEGVLSGRRMRLLAVACARLLCGRDRRACVPKVLELAELYADRVAVLSDAFRIIDAFPDPCTEFHHLLSTPSYCLETYVLRLLNTDCAPLAAHLVREVVGNPFQREPRCPTCWSCARANVVHGACKDCELGRLLSWQNGQLFKMARLIYDNRSFEDLPVLADALEDAGCTDQAMLDHCRRKVAVPCPHETYPRIQGKTLEAPVERCFACDDTNEVRLPHVRGCWLIDWLGGID